MNIRFTTEVFGKLLARAKADGVSIPTVVCRIVEDYFKLDV